MSHDYKMVQWNPFKKRFDVWMLGGVALYLVSFITLTYATQPEGNSFTPIQAMIRATGNPRLPDAQFHSLHRSARAVFSSVPAVFIQSQTYRRDDLS